MRFFVLLSLLNFALFAAPRQKESVLLDPLPPSEIQKIEKEFLTRAGWTKGTVTVDDITGFVTSAVVLDNKASASRKPDEKEAEVFFRKVGELLGVRLLPDFMGEAEDVFKFFKFTKVLGFLQHVEATAENLHYPEYVMPFGPHYHFKARLFFLDGQVARVVSQPPLPLLPKVEDLELSPKYHWSDAKVEDVFKDLEVEVPGKIPQKLKFRDFAEMRKVQASATSLQVRSVPVGKQVWVGLTWVFPVKLKGVEVQLIVSANEPKFLGQESAVF